MPEKKKRWIMFFLSNQNCIEKNQAIIIALAILIAPSRPYLADSLGQNHIISQNIFPIVGN
jgi:hypothetical protein